MPIEGKIFMFTGRISVTRHEAQGLVESLGGTAGSYLSHQTDYLVVGGDPGDKLRRGTEYGTEILSEEQFWNMVKAAKAEPEILIQFTPEQLEDPSCITDSQWLKMKELDIVVITGETLNSVLRVHEPEERKYPPAEETSYGNPDILEKLLKENPDVRVTLGPKKCPYCDWDIPYTIEGVTWWCFRCLRYSGPGQTDTDHLCWSRKQVELDVEGVTAWKCELCRNVVFRKTEELVELERTTRCYNLSHSLETAIQIHQQVAEVIASHAEPLKNYETFNPEVHGEILEAWVERQNRKLERKEAKRQERFERRRRQRNYELPT